MAAEEYIPGVCNIGWAERKRRLIVGWAGVVACVVLWAAFAVLETPAPWRLLLFVPATAGAMGFLQYRMRFCAKLGFDGVFSVGPTAGVTESVEQAEFRRQDRRKSMTIIGLSLLIGAGTALAGWLIPL